MKMMTTTILPEKCWIFSKGRYILRGFPSLPQLPCVHLEYEDLLKHLGIPYRRVIRQSYFTSQEVCEYWNPDVGLNERDLSLPLLAEINGSYRYCERNYSEKVLTDETIEAASKTQKIVSAAIHDYLQILEEVDNYRFAQEQLSGEASTVCFSSGTPYSSVYNISVNHDNFKILRILGYRGLLDYVAIFDMNKIVPNSCITLQVPSHLAGFVIGKRGRNIQAWAEEIGVKKIQVIPIDN